MSYTDAATDLYGYYICTSVFQTFTATINVWASAHEAQFWYKNLLLETELSLDNIYQV